MKNLNLADVIASAIASIKDAANRAIHESKTVEASQIDAIVNATHGAMGTIGQAASDAKALVTEEHEAAARRVAEAMELSVSSIVEYASEAGSALEAGHADLMASRAATVESFLAVPEVVAIPEVAIPEPVESEVVSIPGMPYGLFDSLECDASEANAQEVFGSFMDAHDAMESRYTPEERSCLYIRAIMETTPVPVKKTRRRAKKS